MKLDFPYDLANYIGEKDLYKVLEAWEGYNDLTKLIIISFASPSNSLEFLLSLDSIVRNNKFNNKLKDIINE